MTPLHYAARHGILDLVRDLLDDHAFVDAADEAGWTALDYAAEQGHTETVDVLRQAREVD